MPSDIVLQIESHSILLLRGVACIVFSPCLMEFSCMFMIEHLKSWEGVAHERKISEFVFDYYL